MGKVPYTCRQPSDACCHYCSSGFIAQSLSAPPFTKQKKQGSAAKLIDLFLQQARIYQCITSELTYFFFPHVSNMISTHDSGIPLITQDIISKLVRHIDSRFPLYKRIQDSTSHFLIFTVQTSFAACLSNPIWLHWVKINSIDYLSSRPARHRLFFL